MKMRPINATACLVKAAQNGFTIRLSSSPIVPLACKTQARTLTSIAHGQIPSRKSTADNDRYPLKHQYPVKPQRWTLSTRNFATASTPPSPIGPRPLEGITVISLEQVIAGPYATRHLADMGARVIKIERPGTGDFVRGYDTRANGMCSHFVWTNRSKESLALDVKKAEDLAVLKQLTSTADVFLQNLAPGAADRLGLGYEALREKNERLIVCDISGYGSDGPYRNKKAYDLLIQSESGLLSITGTEETPSKVGCSIADISAGMYAYSNIMAAILQREKTGKGCRIDVSMLECMMEWMMFPMYYAYEGAKPPPRAGASHASIYPYGPFQAKDAKVMLGLQNEREWGNFCEKVLEMPALAKEERFTGSSTRSNNREELRKIIEDVFSTLTAQEVVARLETAAIGNAGRIPHNQCQA